MDAVRNTSQLKSFKTNDSVNIVYRQVGSHGPVVIMLHGWSGSHRYFDMNVEEIAEHCQVYAPDLRFHGDSDKPKWGYHVFRLAADLRDMLQTLQLQDVTVVGSSMGASIIWAYIELYGEDRLRSAVFVDQVPLQNNVDDWKLGNLSCYDAICVARLQTKLNLDFRSIAEGTPRDCLTQKVPSEYEAMLVAETLKADPDALGRLMADHTQIDWRPLLPRIAIPCLNMRGLKNGVFPPEGTAVVTKLIKHCEQEDFEHCNHWLYIEDAGIFNSVLSRFVKSSHGL
ncbi:g7207 [Coccomyxa viridis]|uniref:G7207 protein n=1 Tax=Coccomyxa viridis TaxID=1274662 RepID=A0ABP1FX97_9CHLO